jgi:hypothetical protein
MQTGQLLSFHNPLVSVHILSFCRRDTNFNRKEAGIVDLIVERVDVWAASTVDKPGGLSGILTDLYEAGADLDFIIARRAPEKPGTGVVFLAPLRGDREVKAASTLNFNLTSSVSAVRVEADNAPGAAAKLASLIADADISARGFSVAVIGARFIAYIGFDSSNDAKKAVNIFQEAEVGLRLAS